MSAWEAMPLLDLAIKEVLRLTLSGTSLRRVLKPGVVIDGYEIPVGSFLCYPIGTLTDHAARHAQHTTHTRALPDPASSRPAVPGLTHLDEKIYKEPHKFDPDRFLPPRSEEDSEVFSFLAWGVGASTALRPSHHRT
jgi:sterol 14-demethylase